MKFYLIGIKGSGMASLANLLYEEGYIVEGEDVDTYINSQDNLLKNNIKIYSLGCYLHNDFDVCIIGHSFEDDIIKDKNKIYINYNTFLAFYLKKDSLISICGSHGKTSMVGMLSNILNCSYLKGDGSSHFISSSEYFLLESCEYQDHFLSYKPNQIILLNVDLDHVDYFPSYEDYLASFKKFLSFSKHNFIPYNLKDEFNGVTIGADIDADYSYLNIKLIDNYVEFDIYKKQKFVIHIKTKLKGLQYVEMLTYSYAFCDYNNLNFDISNVDNQILAKRRFVIENYQDSILIDDYAHHPSQIKMHFNNLSLFYKDYYHVAIFKPDRYSRLKYFLEDFENILNKFDEVYVLPLPSMKENINKSHKIFKSKKIKYIDKINDIIIDKSKKTTYSFMSSKEMKNNIDEIKLILKKKD